MQTFFILRHARYATWQLVMASSFRKAAIIYNRRSHIHLPDEAAQNATLCCGPIKLTKENWDEAKRARERGDSMVHLSLFD